LQSLSVVVPVYNSSTLLPRLTKEIETALVGPSENLEVILVNDSSRDRSWEVITELSQSHSWIRGINLMRNVGQHNALLCGIREAKHEIIITMDDDLQNPPSEIIKLVNKLEQGFDVVYGVPERERHNLFRNLASRITKIVLQKAMGAVVARKISSFRVFRTQLRDAFQQYRGPFVSIDVLLTWGTTRFSVVKVNHCPRREGTSGYSLYRLIVHALNMMTGFSALPLQLASLTGFVFTVFGMFILVFVVGRYLVHGSPVPGFPFLASIVAIFSGAQLFALGIIGEYLARVHFRMMDRPPYTIRSVTSDDK
jgi:glycosyltransferase involved in cell wall biosynthesis